MIRILLGMAIVLTVLAGLFGFVARKRSSTLYVERTFAAPVEKVWTVWNDPESLKQWWSPKDYTAPIIKNDFRVGGVFLLSMKSPKGEMFWNTGTYTEIVPHKRIVSSMSFADANGNALPGAEAPVPGQWPDAITVTVEFAEMGGRTRVAITEVGVPLIMKLFAKMGWEQQLDKFQALL